MTLIRYSAFPTVSFLVKTRRCCCRKHSQLSKGCVLNQQDKQCTYERTLRRVRVIIAAEEKREIKHILSLCLYPQLLSVQNTCAMLQRYLWPILLYHIFFINISTMVRFSKKIYRTENVCCDFLCKLRVKYFSFKKNSTRYCT